MSEMQRVDPALEAEKPKVEDKSVEKKEEVKVNKWEAKALEQGWKPKDEWQGDPEEWREAREYVERGELFEKIETQNREMKQLRKVLDTLKDHHLRVKQDSMEEAVKLLKKQREEAKQQEDLTKVLEITEQIDELKEKQTKEVTKAAKELEVPVEAGPTPQFTAWHKTNQWYNPTGRDAMSTFANTEADRYMFEHKSATQEQMLDHVTRRVKEEFPEKFVKAKVDSKVEPAGGGRPSKTTTNEPQLTETEKKIMDTLVKSGVVTKEQYLKDLKKFEESNG